MRFFSVNTALLCVSGLILFSGRSLAANPTAEQALKLEPIQAGVDYDRPAANEAAKCKMSANKIDGHVGWIVESPDGMLLRRFVDTNNDNVVDQWSYFKDGLEVYRDVDVNFNGKADHYRWFHTAGSRWAVDSNEDGEIDAWKTISAEEATAEIVAAIADRDAKRFARLLLTPEELNSLGLGKEQSKNLAAKTARAAADFPTMSARQNTLGRDAAWVQFSAGAPGVVPAGTNHSTKDVRVYENVTAIAESGGQHRQVHIGTLVRVDDRWRVIDLPRVEAEGQAAATPEGFFFQASLALRNTPEDSIVGEMSQKLLSDLEKLDEKAAQAITAADQAKYIAERAKLIERIAQATKSPEQRDMWIRQLADMLSAAVQSGTYEDGVKRLEGLYGNLAKDKSAGDLAAYVKFRQLTAAYFLAMKAPKADFAKIQSEWLKTLERFIADYPTSPDAAEAMLQLAINEEFAGEENAAKKWYGKTVDNFADSPAAQKAAGALTRLNSVGKRIELSGQTPQGSRVDLAEYRGKVVLIQYWATNSPQAKTDMATLKELFNKYGRSLAIIGVNLDYDPANLNAYLSENPLPWKQIHEKGGMDSRPATVMGILTVPTMILVDQQGAVVSRNISTVELESEIKKLIR
ncbi:MAG: redoxin domain-containing protein [Pirellulales bacterium]|nr:redoxin domain-containing protein [Pirellulales bacterium]